MTLKEVFSNIMYYGLESIGKYYSSYRGYVVDIEDKDILGRVKVRIPSVTKNKIHPTWAYPKSQWGGKGYGMQVLPSKGEMVWVEFEHGDTRFPIWSFAHRSVGDIPPEFASTKIYGFKTPKGNVILIDDRDGEEKIVVRALNHFIVESDKIVLDAYELYFNGVIRGTPSFAIGANGAFSSVDGRIIKVTNGIVTDIS